MTKLGQDLIESIKEKLSQPIENTTGAGFAVSNSQDFDFKDQLKEYFCNIINLPFRSAGYVFFKNISNTNYPKDNSDSKPWEYLGQEIEDVSAYRQRTGGVDFFVKDFSIKTEGVLDTKEKWEHFVKKNLENIEQERKNESDMEFNDFINECMNPKNYHDLIEIIKLIEKISEINIHKLNNLSNWIINEDNESLINQLATQVSKNTHKQISKIEFLDKINSFKANPDDKIILLDIMQIVEDHVISKNTKEDNYSNPALKLFISFMTISQTFIRNLSTMEVKNKDNRLIQNFIKQLPEAYNNPDVTIDFFAMSREDLMTQHSEHTKNKLR